jgi:hypothetical protein
MNSVKRHYGGKFEVRIREVDFCLDRFDLYVMERSSNENVISIGKIIMEEYEPGTIVETRPSLESTLDHDSLQVLFNDLWRLGFRPKDGTGNSGHLEAINRHLNDMRAIVANKLGVELK